MKQNIKDYNLDELKEEVKKIGEKPFRAEQIFKWLYVDEVNSFDEMTNLSLELREKLKENFDICNFKILRKLESKDGTKKYYIASNSNCFLQEVTYTNFISLRETLENRKI